MKNTDFNLSSLSGFISSETSFQAVQDMIASFDLEFEGVSSL